MSLDKYFKKILKEENKKIEELLNNLKNVYNIIGGRI